MCAARRFGILCNACNHKRILYFASNKLHYLYFNTFHSYLVTDVFISVFLSAYYRNDNSSLSYEKNQSMVKVLINNNVIFSMIVNEKNNINFHLGNIIFYLNFDFIFFFVIILCTIRCSPRKYLIFCLTIVQYNFVYYVKLRFQPEMCEKYIYNE